MNSPRDRVLEWFLGLSEDEEMCLTKIVMRLQGMVASMARLPTFRRRFGNLGKMLYAEAVQAIASDNSMGVVIPVKGSKEAE
ncbi:hypothetical protein CRG98_050238 [Punica granatum]|uniref:Uncharacterized protein n=1 Tax=Punica granatum TaxID=22663 RepID=A0A2I0GK03_PUNGR|nr:hypothetical protein CRG98_050238 [Punica granatum]